MKLLHTIYSVKHLVTEAGGKFFTDMFPKHHTIQDYKTKHIDGKVYIVCRHTPSLVLAFDEAIQCIYVPSTKPAIAA